MCYAIPGKVEDIKNKIAYIDYFGEKKTAYNEIDDLKIGDYIYAQGGFVIETIPAEKAKSILTVWKETFFELQERDLTLSKLSVENKNLDKKVLNILDRVSQELPVKKEEYLYLLNRVNKEELNLIYKTANFIRHKSFGNSCCVHGIVEISNYCNRNCHYCGISVFNKNLTRYRMSEDEIMEVVRNAVNEYGFKALVLQSGEDSYYTVEKLYKIIKRIKKELAVLIFISFGEIGTEGLEKLYEAGARGLLLRFETSNEMLYEKLHPGYSLKDRIEQIKKADKIGYLIITGGLIGIPGQTKEDILNDIYLAKNLNAEMFSFGPFVPHPDTPMKDISAVSHDEVMKTLAVARFIDREKAKILITTAFETISPMARESGLLAGANSVMLNVTPFKYKKEYSIYPNRAYLNDEIETQITTTINLLRNIGRSPTDLGVSESGYRV